MGGWLHPLDLYRQPVPYVPVRPAIQERPIDAEGLWRQWFDTTDEQKRDVLGIVLGVDTDALRSIGCAWAEPHNAWAFPMRDANGKVIGIRLRNDEGHKWAVKGSKSGLFIPTDYLFEHGRTLWLTEGPTDLAAALTLGLFAIGRPACLGQEQFIIQYLRIAKANRLVILTDNDEPGIRGAERLQSQLPILSCIWVPPVKDIREYLIRGGNKRIIDAAIKDLVWTTPKAKAA